jgi:hypothetical protein
MENPVVADRKSERLARWRNEIGQRTWVLERELSPGTGDALDEREREPEADIRAGNHKKNQEKFMGAKDWDMKIDAESKLAGEKIEATKKKPETRTERLTKNSNREAKSRRPKSKQEIECGARTWRRDPNRDWENEEQIFSGRKTRPASKNKGKTLRSRTTTKGRRAAQKQ